jgi:hypothetical protein
MIGSERLPDVRITQWVSNILQVTGVPYRDSCPGNISKQSYNCFKTFMSYSYGRHSGTKFLLVRALWFSLLF